MITPPTQRDLEGRAFFRIAGRQVPLTDFTTIAVVRAIMGCIVHPEILSLWAGLIRSLESWYIQTATGDALKRRIADFGLTTFPGPTAAYGQLQVTVESAINLAADTIVRTDPTDGTQPRRYSVQPNPDPDAGQNEGDGSWRINESRTVDVLALDGGTAGNTGANTITEPETSIPNLVSITNPSPIVNGNDELTDDAIRQYFWDWLAALSGGTRAAVLFGVLNHTDSRGRRVASAALEEWDGTRFLYDTRVDPPRAVALKVYVDEAVGTAEPGTATASADLVDEVQRLLDGSDTEGDPGLRGAGVPTVAIAATALAVPIDVQVDVTADTPLMEQIILGEILHHFAVLPVSGITARGEQQGQFVLAKLNRDLLNLPNVLQAIFRTPVADVAVPTGYKVVAGTVHVTARVVS